MKKLAILGSTGSIGRSTLDVISQNTDYFRVVALAAGKNLDLLEQQIRLYRPEVVSVANKETADVLNKRVSSVEILSGLEGINCIASHDDVNFVVSAIVGSAGLIPTLTAIKSGKKIGLANKEALVMAGEIMVSELNHNKTQIIPIDSEHSAIFQCIEGHNKKDIEKLVLTASGGPFAHRNKEELDHITAADALQHPNWKMGKKITIDSATLMNKGFEVIEACWLFDMPPEKIDVLIHPQSIVHSMVEFRDRSFLAQMSIPDMRGPISYALQYPDRISNPIPRLELDKLDSLTFSKPDSEKFPCLSYAYHAIKTGGTVPCVLNASNEVAVQAFLENRIGFNDISVIIRRTVDDHQVTYPHNLEDVLEADRWGKEKAEKIVKEIQRC
jgi:1-deoxy-D-xylulose-5-phosphate reductoisomerase